MSVQLDTNLIGPGRWGMPIRAGSVTPTQPTKAEPDCSMCLRHNLSFLCSRRAGFSALPARGPHGRPRGLHLQVHARSGALLKYYIMGSHIEMFSEFKLAERLRCSPFSPFLRLHFQRQKKRFRTTRHNCFAIIDDTPEMRSGFRTSTRFSLLRR